MGFRTLKQWVMPRGGSRSTQRPPRRLALEPLEGRDTPSTLTPVMTGLDNPRGLAVGPEGALYVVEAGRGGNGPSFEPRPGEVVRYGASGAVSRLSHGQQERVATGLPSIAGAGGAGATGAHDISFQGRGNAAVTVGFGADPRRRGELGEAGAGFAQLVRLTASGGWQAAADIGANEAAVNPGGGPVDSNPYGVLAEPGGRVVVDAGGNALLRVAANGDITTLASFPSRDDGRSTDAVPNCVAVGPDGAYYVGELTGVPFAVGAARVYRVVPGQAPEIVHTGFTAIIDLTFGPDGSLYVLQHATRPFLGGDGALIRVAPDGTRTTIASEGLVKPTSVLVGDDGVVYVSNKGIFAGVGEVVRVTPSVPAGSIAWGLSDSKIAFSPGVGGSGLDSEVDAGPANTFGPTILTLEGSEIALNAAGGAGKTAGASIGGGVYVGPGTRATAPLTSIFWNDATTSDDDIFGAIL